MRLLLLAAAAASVLAGAAGAQQATQPGQRLSVDRVFESPDLTGPRARGVKLSPDGSAVTYMKVKPDNLRITDLWIADVSGGAPRLLIDGASLIPQGRTLSEAEKSRRERLGVQTSGVVEYAWDEQGRYILAPVEGDLFLYQRADGQIRQLTNTPGDEIDAKVSPRGTYVSWVRDDNLFIAPSSGGAERAITQGGDELKSWGTAEFIAQEELDRSTGYWWSPDESRIALTFVDQSGVDIIDRPEVGATGATVVRQRYPRTGRPNARVELYVADVASGQRTKVDLGANADIYLSRVNWSKDGKTLYVQRLSRDQRRLDLLSVNPATGASKVILSETSPHWVEATDDFTALKDGSFLWSSDRSGSRHLYLYGRDGKLIRQVTRGAWTLDALEGVDEARGVAFFGASIDTPIERRLYTVSYLKPGQPAPLTKAGGWWTESVAHNGAAFVGTYQDPRTPPQTALYKADGSLVRWIEENRLAEGHPYWPYASTLSTPTFGTIKAADGQDLHWSMRTPPGFDPSRKYPVIVQVYGGPHAQQVKKDWASPEDRLFLEAGYILFRLDNRGSANRPVRFQTALDRRLGSVEVQDQVAGARYLQTLPYVDAGKIGVTGWSYGGYMTLMMLTAENSPFAAGVSGAPVTDWSLYDTAYTERYMGTPQQNPEGYKAGDVLTHLDRLKPGSVMILHGMADDNVTFDNATRVFASLQAKAIPFETMVYPGLRHRAGWTPANRKHRALVTLDFFNRKLKGAD
ncbi:S9 family peptidase [Phenylobacterium deserti]|uniref:S9 family peptidase n=1 Tax=Phenylobacterium deserti TaxID=1914756 RepID=A0A328AQV4_9CAUL|nr:S9 family peptidase [Phenylobacterium deserti]RAK56675.1 S9 family peptidase [Phenylobacterium deserti]